MKNVLKICLVLVLCLSVLMVAGCKSESKKGENTDKTPETTGTNGSAENEGQQGGENAGNVDKNPEGDPFEDTDVGADDEIIEGPDPTEPPIGVQDGEGEQEDEFDFEIDFGEE